MTFCAKVSDLKTGKIHAQSEPVGVASDAWLWLRDERQREEDKYPTDVGEYSDIWAGLDYLASGDASYGDPLDDWGYDARDAAWVLADNYDVLLNNLSLVHGDKLFAAHRDFLRDILSMGAARQERENFMEVKNAPALAGGSIEELVRS